MRTLQMTFDDDLVTELDQVVQESHTNRSAFTREALRMAIALYHQRTRNQFFARRIGSRQIDLAKKSCYRTLTAGRKSRPRDNYSDLRKDP